MGQRSVKHPFYRGPQQIVITIYCPSDVDQMQHSLSWVDQLSTHFIGGHNGQLSQSIAHHKWTRCNTVCQEGRPVKHPFYRGPQQTVITIYCPSDVDQMQHSLSWVDQLSTHFIGGHNRQLSQSIAHHKWTRCNTVCHRGDQLSTHFIGGHNRQLSQSIAHHKWTRCNTVCHRGDQLSTHFIGGHNRQLSQSIAHQTWTRCNTVCHG